MLADGSATLTIRFLHMTNKGESIRGIGNGTQIIPNQKGIAQVTGEVTLWTSAPRLSQLNGGKWTVNGEVNIIKETIEVQGKLEAGHVKLTAGQVVATTTYHFRSTRIREE